MSFAVIGALLIVGRMLAGGDAIWQKSFAIGPVQEYK